MPRIPRLLVRDEPAVYHVMSRVALEGYVLGPAEKDELLRIIQRMSSVYFAELLGFCLMGNHFHLLVRMHPGDGVSEAELRRRFGLYWGRRKKVFPVERAEDFRRKWGSLSEYVREIKQEFSRYYNRRHHRRGFFWGDRFKSVIVEDGDTLVNCLAYIDLNPVRAGLVDRPESYRWSSVGYHVQRGNRGGLLSTDFGLVAHRGLGVSGRFRWYREFLYEKGALGRPGGSGGGRISSEVLEGERARGFELGRRDRFLYRTRYFTDSGVIGSREFVARQYERFRWCFGTGRKKDPRRVIGLSGIYSLKRLSEAI